MVGLKPSALHTSPVHIPHFHGGSLSLGELGDGYLGSRDLPCAGRLHMARAILEKIGVSVNVGQPEHSGCELTIPVSERMIGFAAGTNIAIGRDPRSPGIRARPTRDSTSSVAKKGSGMMRRNLHPVVMAVFAAGLASSSATGLSAQERTDNPYTSPQDVQAGEQLFGSQCTVCHGVGATGGEIGPDLSSGVFSNASTDAGLFGVISEGIPNTAMIGINEARTDQSVWQIVTYLRSLSGGQRVAVPGDATDGERLFRGEGNCVSCHTVGGEGGRHGPDLSTIGERRSPEQLRSDLVDPNERVQPRWWRMRVTHVDGTRIVGLRMNEGTYSVRILDDEDNLWSLQKRDLRDSYRIETSSMPAYGNTLTQGQLDHLVAYLYGLIDEDP